MLPPWVIEKRLKEIKEEAEYCKQHNIDPHDLIMEFEIEVVSYVRRRILWFLKKKVTKWQKCNECVYMNFEGRKRWKFETLEEWTIIEPKGAITNEKSAR